MKICKITTLLLLLAMITGMAAGCGETVQETETSADTAATETETAPTETELTTALPADLDFGGESVTYEGSTNKKWERLESYGPKLVENIVQAIARDILCYALQTLSHCFIVAHVHDEIIIEADRRMSVEAVCEQMARVPDWAEGLQLRADGYECEYYKKD